jgi:hypothetical protein
VIASSRNYPFKSRVTTINALMYSCMVSTTKEGLFKKNSTMILEMPHGQLDLRRPVAKIIYTPSLRASDRLQMHELIVKLLDESGDSITLGNAIKSISELLKERGIATEVINIAV